MCIVNLKVLLVDWSRLFKLPINEKRTGIRGEDATPPLILGMGMGLPLDIEARTGRLTQTDIGIDDSLPVRACVRMCFGSVPQFFVLPTLGQSSITLTQVPTSNRNPNPMA
jgi:hypothetical protein